MAFWFEDHTADVTLLASGNSLSEAFSQAAIGLTRVMTDESIRVVDEYPIDVCASSVESVFFDFLAQLIFLLDTQGLFVSKADITVVEEKGSWCVRGCVSGDHASRYEHSGDVKAPTFNRLAVFKEEGEFVVSCTLDL